MQRVWQGSAFGQGLPCDGRLVFLGCVPDQDRVRVMRIIKANNRTPHCIFLKLRLCYIYMKFV